MPLKKKTTNKIAIKPPLEVSYAKQFWNDWKDLQHSGACNMERLKALMVKLVANDGPLDAVHLEHELNGKWAGFRECHMGGDVLLIYDRTESTIVFARTGSHAKLF